MRIPYWCDAASLKINGKSTKLVRDGGYATIRRKWKTGDRVTLTLPMKPRIEPTNDDPNVIALMYGPMVLAADLGDAKEKFDCVAPALVGSDLLASMKPDAQFANFKTSGIGRPSDLSIRPFFSQWERRTAVYYKKFTDAEWAKEQTAYAAEQARLKDLQARSVDVMHLGEMQPERDHELRSDISYPVSYRGKNGRDARTGGFFEFKSKVVDEPLTLQATYWGQERKRLFHILIDGTRIASETLGYNKMGEFIERDYPIPQELLKGKSTVTVRFEPEKGHTAGPVFGVLIFKSN